MLRGQFHPVMAPSTIHVFPGRLELEPRLGEIEEQMFRQADDTSCQN